MRNSEWYRWLCLGLLFVGISACTKSTAKIESYTAKEHHADIRRLLIVSNVWPVDSQGASSALETQVIETALVKAFSRCGIVADVLPRDQHSLAADDAQAIRAFSPDALFVLETKTFQVGIEHGGGVYLARIVDMATKQMTWRAQIQITTGESREDVFTKSIVDRLKEDSVLCSS